MTVKPHLTTIFAVEAIEREGEMVLAVSSPAFQEGGKIPPKYTCEGQDVSPALTWGEPPVETRSFVLVVDDPDAPGGVFTHWLLFNLPAGNRELSEAVPAQDQLYPSRTGAALRFDGGCIQKAGYRCYAGAHPCTGSAYGHVPTLACQVALIRLKQRFLATVSFIIAKWLIADK